MVADNDRKRIAVFSSGTGNILKTIVNGASKDVIPAVVSFVCSDREDAPVLEYAKVKGIATRYIAPANHTDREHYCQNLLSELKQCSIDLIVLDSFKSMLSPHLIDSYPLKILNAHPSLLPAFPGENSVRETIEFGSRVTGCTIHFVAQYPDCGPIVMQQALPVLDRDTAVTLRQRIQAARQRLYPLAIELFCRDKIMIKGRRCIIID